MADIILSRPLPGQAINVAPQTDDRINLEFTADSATITREGDSLTFTFEDGASIELTNFYTAYGAENMPEFVIEGSTVSGEAFFTSLGEELMPALGNTSAPSGSGTNVGFKAGTLLSGIDATDGLNIENELVVDIATASVVQPNNDLPFTPTETTPPPTTGSATPPITTLPTTPAPPVYTTKDDLLAADAGSRLTGNLLANDEVPEGTIITQITLIDPTGWRFAPTTTGGTIFIHENGTYFSVNPDGTYTLTTNIDNIGADNFEFIYTATDPDGVTYDISVTVGNDVDENLFVENLQADSAIVTDVNTNTSYTQEFSSYANDANAGNHHVNGMLLGDGDDTLTVKTATGTQNDLNKADFEDDTFIYGDALNLHKQEDVGNDIINIDTLNGTKIRADGNLFNGVEGGDDTVNVENMEYGSILGDGWTLNAGTKGGDDVINVGTMKGGEIYGEGKVVSNAAVGGDDQINIDKIDLSASGNQSIVIDGDSGNDTVTVDDIETNSGDRVNIDGGLGDDIFNYNSNTDDTIVMRGNEIFIRGEDQTDINNFEGLASGGGNDLVKLYGNVDDVVSVDTGDGLDVLLADASELGKVMDMVQDGHIANAELIVFSDTLNNLTTTSTQDLFSKLDGVEQDENGDITVDSSWTQQHTGNIPDGYTAFTNTNDDGDAMTILVAQIQLANTSS